MSGGGAGGAGQANPWMVGLAVAVVLGAVSIIAFGFLSPDDGTAASTSTTAPEDGATTTSDGSGTTSTSIGDGSSTTTDGSGTVTTTSLPDGGTPPITPVGEAIPIAQLKMTVDGIGELALGDDGDEVLGRLAATFGDPSDDTGFQVGSGSFGECAGDPIRVVYWGPLVIVVKGEPGDSQFVSYRIDLRYGGITSPTTDIQTQSGLRVSDTVGQMKAIYAGLSLEFVVDPDVGLVFELHDGLGGELLLWGPVESQDDDALVTGIYSPDSCG
ncbi:MAG: hypothetical protein H6Q11_367 [Acidobacteria bacterium]|nr:hypothetical protein [Acidobacteriota bacterium]